LSQLNVIAWFFLKEGCVHLGKSNALSAAPNSQCCAARCLHTRNHNSEHQKHSLNCKQ